MASGNKLDNDFRNFSFALEYFKFIILMVPFIGHPS